MRRSLPGAIVGLLVAVGSLVGVSSAFAATEVGNSCAATGGIQGVAFVQLGEAPGNPLPLTVPTSGVVIKWKVTREFPDSMIIEDKLKVYRSTASATTFEVVGESPLEVIEPGLNVFDARIPVDAGDRFGLYGASPGGGLSCDSEDARDVIGESVGDTPVGAAQAFGKEVAKKKVAVSALVEPDADHDGYGDETQDKCSLSAAIQAAPCPPWTLSSFALARRGSATLFVSHNALVPTHVTASGSVKLVTAGRKRVLRASARVLLSSQPQTVAPGQITQFRFTFPKRLKSALRNLSPKRSVHLDLEARATDPAGTVATTASGVKLRGQAPSRK